MKLFTVAFAAFAAVAAAQDNGGDFINISINPGAIPSRISSALSRGTDIASSIRADAASRASAVTSNLASATGAVGDSVNSRLSSATDARNSILASGASRLSSVAASASAKAANPTGAAGFNSVPVVGGLLGAGIAVAGLL